MDPITIFLTGTALSMDAFAISLARGMCLRTQRLWFAVKTALFFGIAQAVMPVAGFYAGRTFSAYIHKYDHWAVVAILGFIGVKMIAESIRANTKKPEDICPAGTGEADSGTGAETRDAAENLNNGTKMLRSGKSDNILLFSMAIATSIDALAAGVGFSMLGDYIIMAAAAIGIITFTICLAGVLLGKRAGILAGGKAEVAGGVMLIGIGIKIFLEHLVM